MRVVVGLGNPGEEYRDSRHNAGYLVVAGLAAEFRIELRAGRGDFVSGVGRIAGEAVELILPLTYMNRSGDAVRDALGRRGATPDDLLVVCDDVDLPLGQLRLRRRGGGGGHNGLGSIIAALTTDEFARLRLGVGRPPEGVATSDFVLDRFLPGEEAQVADMKRRGIDAVVLALREGLEAAMNLYNRKLDPEGGRLEEDG